MPNIKKGASGCLQYVTHQGNHLNPTILTRLIAAFSFSVFPMYGVISPAGLSKQSGRIGLIAAELEQSSQLVLTTLQPYSLTGICND
jgi:hypothetical protein